MLFLYALHPALCILRMGILAKHKVCLIYYTGLTMEFSVCRRTARFLESPVQWERIYLNIIAICHVSLFQSWRYVQLPELVFSESGYLSCSAIIAKSCMHSIKAGIVPATDVARRYN